VAFCKRFIRGEDASGPSGFHAPHQNIFDHALNVLVTRIPAEKHRFWSYF
jgi:hypothetical protein